MKRSGFKQKLTVPLKRTPFKRPTKPKVKSKKPKGTSYWKKQLDAVFSRYIRYRDKGKCFTCPHTNDPKKMQCGHFNPRQYLSTRYDEKNCNCQCYACNMLYGGQPATYAIRLKEKYGEGIVEELEKGRWIPVLLDEAWYKEQIEIYQNKLNELQKCL